MEMREENKFCRPRSGQAGDIVLHGAAEDGVGRMGLPDAPLVAEWVRDTSKMLD